ncbi:MAG: TraB/GumN family protein [Chitinophagaceae bacterium]|nr:TraB/GumN family protein [Chitinophagaceae bacterium]
MSLVLMMSLISFAGCFGQESEVQQGDNTLLWKVTGNGLTRPSYLFGTIHMICKEDAGLSANLQKIIRDADEVYFEVDLDNLLEMVGMVSKFKMRGDTTLKDLLTEAEYNRVKAHFEQHNSLLPFSMLETYKPILAASVLGQSSMPCESMSAMEQEIMAVAKKANKNIKGLETMDFQASVLDNIPYSLQAAQLVKFVDNASTDSSDVEMQSMMQAYRDQDLSKLEKLITDSDPAIANYTDILLIQRNKNWVEKMKTLMVEKSLLFAVGAGHLPGEEGVIELLRKAGFTVTPESNKTTKVI